jgi:integrase/recombinase XerD
MGLDAAKAWFLFADYLKQRNFSTKTKESYRLRVGYFFDFLERSGMRDLGTVGVEHMIGYCQYLDGRKRKLSEHSRRSYFRTVRSLWRFLARHEHVKADVAAAVEYCREKESLFPRALSEDEVKSLLAAPDMMHPRGVRDRAMLEVLYGTGIRKSELVALAIADVSFEEQLLFIRQGKGMKDRLVPFGNVARHWLRKWIEDVRPRFLGRKPGPDAVFLTMYRNAVARASK